MADIEKFVYYSNGSKKVLKPTDRIVVGSGGLALEGETSNDYETELAVVDPTADRTITFPNATGNRCEHSFRASAATKELLQLLIKIREVNPVLL